LIIKTGLEVIFEVKLIIVYKIVTALWASPKRKLERNMWLPKKKKPRLLLNHLNIAA